MNRKGRMRRIEVGRHQSAMLLEKLANCTQFHTAGKWWLCPLSSSLTFDSLPLFSFLPLCPDDLIHPPDIIDCIHLPAESTRTSHFFCGLKKKMLAYINFWRRLFFPRGFHPDWFILKQKCSREADIWGFDPLTPKHQIVSSKLKYSCGSGTQCLGDWLDEGVKRMDEWIGEM